MASLTLLLLTIFIVTVISHPNTNRNGKGKDPRNSSKCKKNKICNWDFTILGHRGGSSGFIPEHSVMSYTLGAQHGADYLEPDITFTSDGVQIIRHHPKLDEATNVDEIFDKSSDKYTPDDTIVYYWRTVNEGGPSAHPYKETSGGYFSWDFTYDETQLLSLISDDLSPSPFDNLKVMKFEDLLILIKDIMPVLNRPIGLIPELKYPHEYRNRTQLNVELENLDLLADHGYLRKENDYYYVKTLCEFGKDSGLTECDEEFYANKASVIIQSFNAPSLIKFKEYTDAPLIYLSWYDYDLLSEEFIEWVKTFANGLGLNTPGVPMLKETLKNINDDELDAFLIFEYTLGFDVAQYFETLNNDFINGVFTDDSNTARVVQETLDYISENDVKIKSSNNQILYLMYGIVIGILVTICVGVIAKCLCAVKDTLPTKMVKEIKSYGNNYENERLK